MSPPTGPKTIRGFLLLEEALTSAPKARKRRATSGSVLKTGSLNPKRVNPE
jgi:hypothetical protein